MNLNLRTAKKYADKDDWNQPLAKQLGRYPVLGPFLEIIDTWLLEDEALPRKQPTHLEKEALEDRQRLHYAKKEKVDVLWQEEHKKLYSLPLEPFEVFRLDTGRLNKDCELTFENIKYPLPQCNAEQPVLLKVKWDRIA